MAIGAQDVDHSSGSRTGAISIQMLEECGYGVEFVIIGHSERREFFHENNDLIRKKIQALDKSKISTTILCIGETEEENKRVVNNYWKIRSFLNSNIVWDMQFHVIARTPIAEQEECLNFI